MSHVIFIKEINAELELDTVVSWDTSRTGYRIDEAYFVFESLTFSNVITVTDEKLAQELGKHLWEDFNLDAIIENEIDTYDWQSAAQDKACSEADALYDAWREG